MLKTLLLLLQTFNLYAAQANEIEWDNSKYHDHGNQWWVFAGLLIFYVVFLGAGLITETCFKWHQEKWLDAQNLRNGEASL